MKTVALREIAEINPAGPPSGSIATDELVAFVPMAAVSEEGEVSVLERRPYGEVLKGFTPFRRGDVLVAKITPCFENNKIGVADIATNQAFGSTEFHVVRCINGTDPKYLVHYLRQDRIRAAGERRMTGSAGQRRVPKAFLDELAIPLPAFDEQKRIAAILDRANEQRFLCQRFVGRLDDLAQAIFHEMFGRLKSSATFGELIERIESGKNLVADDVSASGGYRVLKISAISRTGFNPLETKALPPGYVPPETHLVKKGDLLFSRANTAELVGLAAIADQIGPNVALPDKLWRLIPNKRATNAIFLAQLFKQPSVRRQLERVCSGTSGSMKNVSMPKLLAIAIPCPKIESQEQFASRIEAVERLRASVRQQTIAASRLVKSLEDRAFRGEL